MKKKLTYKNILKLAYLLAGLAITGSASAGLINSDFSAGLNKWGGDIVYYDVVNDIDNNDVFDVDFSNFTDNFSTSGNTVTLRTSADDNNEYWGIYLFQQFIVKDDSLELSLNIESISDYAYVTLVDEDLNVLHDFMNWGLTTDISRFFGSSVSLEIGIEDGDFVYDDYLTVSNISISKRPASVPEPSTFALFALSLIAIRKKLAIKQKSLSV